MQLKSIEFQDFRQFYGTQKIEFANEEKNTTIIFGENGKGKTGIFRGLMFSLFGHIYLSQDNKNDKVSKIHLINWKKLEESDSSIAAAKVTTVFTDNGREYKITRIIRGTKIGTIINERIAKVELEIKDEVGNTLPLIHDEEIIKEELQNIVNEDVKDFFFFDGEDINMISKTDKEVRKKIKNGIIKLLKIKELGEATDILSSLSSSEERRIANESSNNDLKKIIKEKEQLEEERGKLESRKNNFIENKEKCDDEIINTEKKLSENEGIKEIQTKIVTIKEIIKNKENYINEIKKNFRQKAIAEVTNLMMENEFRKALNYLENTMSKNDNFVNISALERILRDEKCICGTDLLKEKDAYINIENLIKNYKRSEASEILNLINETNRTTILLNNDKKQEKTIRKDLKKIKEEKEELDSLEKKKEKELEKIKEFSRDSTDLERLEKTLEKLNKDSSEYRNEIIKLGVQIENINKALKENETEYERLLQSDKSLINAKNKIKKLNLLTEEFKKLFGKYTFDMRSKLMEETTLLFKKLIDEKDKDLLDRVEVNSNYELDFYNWDDIKITQDISQGQRQIVALAFITALAKISSNGSINNFPLFMDTPFGKMSGRNRDNLIENIPNLTSQWILLLTDTEFSISEEEKIKEVGTLGKWYVLEQMETGYTQIIEKKLTDSIAKRG